jgi:phosphorylase kinase alpha/beta subunit
MIGVKYNSKRLIDSKAILSQMTPGEQAFRLHISHVLNKIQSPVFRQLSVETLYALGRIFRDNPELSIDDMLVTDILIGHAVRIHWLKKHPHLEDHYEESVTLAWQSFYQQPPHVVANSIQDALHHLLDTPNA